MNLNQGLEPYRKEPVLEPEPFEYWEPKPHRNPNFDKIKNPNPHRNPYLNYFKNRNFTGTDTFK